MIHITFVAGGDLILFMACCPAELKKYFQSRKSIKILRSVYSPSTFRPPTHHSYQKEKDGEKTPDYHDFVPTLTSSHIPITIIPYLIIPHPSTVFIRYKASDVRSLDFDSLRLAKEEVEDLYIDYSESLPGFEKDRLQERQASIVAWVYEAKKSHGLFTKKGIEVMHDAEATILDDEEYPDFCQLEYMEDDSSRCRKPLSVINIFYASQWNEDVANEVIDAFETDTTKNIDRFNAFSSCLLFDDECNDFPDGYDETDLQWAESINGKINSIIDNWDGGGSLNPNIDKVTKFMAYMKALTIKSKDVNYFLDEAFSWENPVNMYSRSVFYWGGNLKDNLDDSEESTADLKE